MNVQKKKRKKRGLSESTDIIKGKGGFSTLINLNEKRHKIRRKRGLSTSTDPVGSKYDYLNKDVNLVFQVCRYPNKRFKQRRPDGKGDWIWDLKGVKKILYRLSEAIKADTVYIVEGEKDVDRLVELGLTATCNPGGAGNWKDEYNNNLKDKTIIILPDNDIPGQKHAQKVAESLNDIAKSIKIVELPGLKEREDVSDWLDGGKTKEDLLNECKKAKEYNPKTFNFRKSFDNSLVERNGKIFRKSYTKAGGANYKPITSFRIEPIESIFVEGEGEYVTVNLISGYLKSKITFLPDSWLNTQRFLKSLPSKEYTFTGTNVDVQLLREYLTKFDMPHRKGIKFAGFYDGHFVTEYGSMNDKGFSDEIVYVNEIKSHCKLTETKSLTRNENFELLTKFNIPEVALPILGFTTACFFKPSIMDIMHGFSTLGLFGEAGAGKTSTLKQVIMRIWNIDNEPHSIPGQSKFSLMKLVIGSNCIPLCLEENKATAQSYQEKMLVSNLIRSTYNTHEGQRGRYDQSLVTYRYEAPVVIAGESGFIEPALLDRVISVEFSKRDSLPHKNEFLALQKLPLEALGKLLLEKALITPKEKIKKMLEKEIEEVNEHLIDRPRNNAGICYFGLSILKKVIDLDIDDYSPINITVIEGISDGEGIERKSAVDKIIETICLMSTHRVNDPEDDDEDFPLDAFLKSGLHYQLEKDSKKIRLWIAKIYPEFRKWEKHHGFEGDLLPESTFKKQLKKESYFIENNKARIGSRLRSAYILDIDKMKVKGLEISEEWDPV